MKNSIHPAAILANGLNDRASRLGASKVVLPEIAPISVDPTTLETARKLYSRTKQSELIRLVTEAGFEHATAMTRSELIERLAFRAAEEIAKNPSDPFRRTRG